VTPPSRLARAVALIAVAAVLAACGIDADSHPRDISGTRQQELAAIGRSNDQAPAGGSRVFLVDGAGGQDPVLRAVAREVPSEPDALIGLSTLINALFEGPTASERARRLRTAIPAGTELIDADFEGPGTVSLDLSANILDASGDSLVAAVAQIVYTLGQLDNIEGVQLKVEGEARQWPTGDGTLTSAPLTVYLYPGRAASTQPDYPALPSATPPV
jgi:spore germination protein GerM